jgi:hypothetical protein
MSAVLPNGGAMRFSIIAIGCLVLLPTVPANADDGPTLYKQLCATCHDSGVARAPTKDVLQAMTPERVLTAMESGPMLSMASGRTGVERRATRRFVTGKTFSAALNLRHRRRRCAVPRPVSSPTR